VDDEALRRVTLYGTCENCGQPRDVKVAVLPDGGTEMDLHCPACAQRQAAGDPCACAWVSKPCGRPPSGEDGLCDDCRAGCEPDADLVGAGVWLAEHATLIPRTETG
jgi:hypothetical protein